MFLDIWEQIELAVRIIEFGDADKVELSDITVYSSGGGIIRIDLKKKLFNV